MLYKKNRLSTDPRAIMGLLADLNKAVIPKYFLFDFINTEGYFVRYYVVFGNKGSELKKFDSRSHCNFQGVIITPLVGLI